MISLRFAPAVVVIAAVALIPTVIHSYWGLTIDDGLRVSAIPEVLAGARSKPTDRKARWVEANLASTDWFERTYTVGAQDVRLFVARSYDAKRLYHHPELALLRGTEAEPAGRARLPGRPEVPIHVLNTSRAGRNGSAVYALLYEGRYVENPVLFQIKTSAKLLFSGRKPMTLFLASDSAGSSRQIDKAPAVAVLTAAIQAFETAMAGAGTGR